MTAESIESSEVTETVANGEETRENKFPKANLLNRFLAKFIDFLIIGALAVIIKAPVGSLAALTYSLIADGFIGGRSLGKRLIGLRVLNLKTGMPCNFRDSIFRNVPIGLTVMFALIPILGWILLFTVGAVIILFECYLIYTDLDGIRIGDILADTVVVDMNET